MNSYIAAIDAGTNSFHMIIARIDRNGEKLSVIDKEKEIVRLGAGSANMKFITEEAMTKAVQTLKRFKRICRSKKASIRAVGTSAVREAVNSDFFIKKVRVETGIDIEVISGFEEARLIYQGVLHALPVYGKKVLVIDIGGGSTEFLVGERNNIFYGNSLKIGNIRLTEMFFQGKRIKRKAVKKCEKYVEGMLFPVVRAIKKEGYSGVIGSSGTIANVLQMIRKFTREEATKTSAVFTSADFQRLGKRILSAGSVLKIAAIPGMDKKRADIILPGIIILKKVFEMLRVNEMHVSDYALREGVIFDTYARRHPGKYAGALRDLRYRSVISLGRDFQLEEGHALHTARLALEIFDRTKMIHRMGAAEREYLHYGAILHDIGLVISHSQHHLHSYYLIRNAELFGFTENEKEIMANVGRYHRKSHPKIKHPGFMNLAEKDRDTVKKLAAILRIADGLDRMHSSAIKLVDCRVRAGTVTFVLRHGSGDRVDISLWGAETKKFLFEDVFELKVNFESQVKPAV